MRGCVVIVSRLACDCFPDPMLTCKGGQRAAVLHARQYVFLSFGLRRESLPRTTIFVLISIRAARLAESQAAVVLLRMKSLAQGLSMRAVYNN
jgi:hypothetical protein